MPLPPHAAHAAYVPFSALFAAVSAVVHNGGVGTMSQALRAGVPQVRFIGSPDTAASHLLLAAAAAACLSGSAAVPFDTRRRAGAAGRQKDLSEREGGGGGMSGVSGLAVCFSHHHFSPPLSRS